MRGRSYGARGTIVRVNPTSNGRHAGTRPSSAALEHMSRNGAVTPRRAAQNIEACRSRVRSTDDDADRPEVEGAS
jgi:hypothetical protein